MEIVLVGEKIQLLPEKGIFWKKKATLIITDLHLGKSLSLRKKSIPIPSGTTDDDLSRLSKILKETRSSRLVILGDVIHAKSSQSDYLSSKIVEWRRSHSSLEIVLVRGNHDLKAGDPPSSWNFNCVDEPFYSPPFELRHHPVDPVSEDGAGGYAIAGHLHPSVRLVGKARESLRLPGFVFGPHSGILPAFGGFTGTSLVRPSIHDRVFVVTDRSVLEVKGDVSKPNQSNK